jgi:hypothetical protein
LSCHVEPLPLKAVAELAEIVERKQERDGGVQAGALNLGGGGERVDPRWARFGERNADGSHVEAVAGEGVEPSRVAWLVGLAPVSEKARRYIGYYGLLVAQISSTVIAPERLSTSARGHQHHPPNAALCFFLPVSPKASAWPKWRNRSHTS